MMIASLPAQQTIWMSRLNPPLVSRTCLYDAGQVDALIDTMADQVAGLVRADRPPVFIGILRRGKPLADRLVERLVKRHAVPAPQRLDLKVKRYADDLTLLHPETRLDEDAQFADVDLKDRSLWVIDDVLYSGHSLVKVVAHLASRQPAEIRVAVLVDRCAARLPVRADVVGARLQVTPGSIVECHVPPYEPDLAIELVQALPTAQRA